MSLIDVVCHACDDRVEEVYRKAVDHPKTPPCSKCGGPTEQIHLPSYMRGHPVDPVVVYQAPDGTFRFPPDTTTSSTAMYDKKGFTRIELRGFADVRRFEKHMNAAELSQVRRQVERKAEQFEQNEKERRSEVRRGLEQGFQMPERDEKGQLTGRTQTVRLSPYARDIMRAAMDRNDQKGGPKVKEPNFYSDAYSNSASNRDPDPTGRGRR